MIQRPLAPSAALEEPSFPPPKASRVARRAMVLCAVTLRGYLDQAPDAAAARTRLDAVRAWMRAHDLESEVEAGERAFLDAPIGAADAQAVVDASWRSEGVVVLGWALGLLEVPPHDREVVPGEVARALGFLAEGRPASFDATLREPAQIDAMATRLVALHGRLRQPRANARPFRELATASPLGPIDLAGISMVGDDLAIDGIALATAPEDRVATCASVAAERHHAINWLCGDAALYADVKIVE